MPKNITHKFQVQRYQIDSNQIIYIDENEFIKRYKGLRRVSPKTFKYLCFKFFKQDICNKPNGTYVDVLPSSKEFQAIYGDIKLQYTIKDKKIIIEDLTPEKILVANYMKGFQTYKGIPYVDEKDKFKIEMYMRRNANGMQ